MTNEINTPEHVVEEMNRLHITDTGVFMGENWPLESQRERERDERIEGRNSG